MAAMTTVLTEFANNGNSRTYTLPLHTAIEPEMLIQKRKVPSGNQIVIEDTITVVAATKDSAGAVLASRDSISVTIRRPSTGTAADITALLAIFRDVIAGDEFANVVNTQEFLV